MDQDVVVDQQCVSEGWNVLPALRCILVAMFTLGFRHMLRCTCHQAEVILKKIFSE